MQTFLDSTLKLFAYYRELGDKTFAQIPDDKLNWQPDPESNSIAVMVKHLHGNMLSRWTDFLHSDGEKEWRYRDGEFEDDIRGRETLWARWNEGWDCLMNAIRGLNEADLDRTVYIRNMGHSVVEAIQRQLAHYAYHVGQIVYLGRQIAGEKWESLSIAKGGSKDYNQEKFAREKGTRHFTEDL